MYKLRPKETERCLESVNYVALDCRLDIVRSGFVLGFVATDAADGDELYRSISMGQRVYMECI